MKKYLKGTANYDKTPVVQLDAGTMHWQGWDAITDALKNQQIKDGSERVIVVVDLYHGVFQEEVQEAFERAFDGHFYDTREAMKSTTEIEAMLADELTDDAIFGHLTKLRLLDFFDTGKVENIANNVVEQYGLTFLIGVGASLIYPKAAIKVYIDMARWEIQQRFRRNEISNVGTDNKDQKTSLQYKRAYFIDWRVCDAHKKEVIRKSDFVIDANKKNRPVMLRTVDWKHALEATAHRPFRVVPFFDPGPWGGQWMKEYCDLDPAEKNYAWCFDGVPEENSILLKVGDIVFETPAINLVFFCTDTLLGAKVAKIFGDEFPIRFDFLDTMDGGNLSLQVHPTNEFIRKEFGMAYTQDESYYILDAEEDACVYLGLKEDISITKMQQELRTAQEGAEIFDADRYVEKWPAKKHDHFLIPAGTIHCSGKNSMVLEISATPYIFTFKLWDWNRLGLDGLPRPINIDRGMKVLNTERTTQMVGKELINTVEQIAKGDGWQEERTGLHRTQFIETRRHWFTKKVTHHTCEGVNVLNLVEGREAIIESPDEAFEPMVVHYAETFIVPASVGPYTIRPYGESEGMRCGTVKAYVRTE